MGEASVRLAAKVAQLEQIAQEQNLRITAQMVVVRMLLGERLDPADREGSAKALAESLKATALRMAQGSGRPQADVELFARRMDPQLDALVADVVAAKP